MLNIAGPATRFCDGVTRRSFLKVGSFAFGSTLFTLADVMRAEAVQGRSNPHKAVINIFLGGGPPHQDMWDLKMDAPAEIRGEFKPITTSVPGIQICEVFPRLASLMHKSVVIRSVVGASGNHDAVQCMTGWAPNSLRNMGGRPSVGSAVSRLLGPADPSVPPFIGLAATTQHRPWSDAGQFGFLGAAYAPFKPEGPSLDDMRLTNISTSQFDERRRLLTSFDQLRSDLDDHPLVQTLDANRQRALGVLTSSKLLEALDISREPLHTRERYGSGQPYQFQFDGAPTVNDQLLIARRLVEAGARCVSLSYGRWDSHGQNFNLVRDHGGKLDQCLSALIEDLDVRGMLDDVTVIAWGEFGRTPRINAQAGRDHWPQVSCAFMAGGGMRTGQVIGSTNRLGETANTRPVTFSEILATIYHNLGIDTGTATVVDPTGRPTYLVEGSPMREVV